MTHRSLRLPVLILLVVLAVAGGVLLFSRSRQGSSRAVALPPLHPLQIVPGPPAMVVEEVSGSSLLLQTASGARRVSLPAGLSVELLRPAPASTIKPGDWLSLGGAANQINSFAVKQVVVIPAAEANSGGNTDEPPRSRDGFTGFEGERDATIGPAVYGRVRAVSAAVLTLDGPAGAVTVQLPPDTQVLRLQSGAAAQISDGDRLVFAGSADPASATAVLARP